MRSFITLEFSEEIKDNIAKVQSVIRENSEYGRFKYIDNFHLTLKFLGELPNEIINSIGKDIESEVSDENPFFINLKGIDGFGIGNTIKTIYIKVHGENEKLLLKLAKKVDGVCKKYGFKSEKTYIPHITIAQEVKLKIPFEKLKEELNYEFCKDICFDRVILMKSQQIGNKRVYTPIKTVYFNK